VTAHSNCYRFTRVDTLTILRISFQRGDVCVRFSCVDVTFPEFVFRGDSSYVCNKFPSSEELSEHVIRTVRATNTSNKEEMLLLLDQHQL
jgi:hypothetical protein